jgi:hypothetical protein
MRPIFVQSGQRFGRGVVIDPEVRVTLSGGNTYRAARLRCDCGNEYTAYIFNIRTGNTKSCGCFGKEARRESNRTRTVYGRSARAKVLSTYRRNARLRGYVWELKDEDFNRLTSSPCFYCGCAPSHITSVGQRYGDFIYNGIDRSDNTKGYTLENAVPCCHTCNTAKQDMPLTEFEAWLDRVASFRSTSAIRGIAA